MTVQWDGIHRQAQAGADADFEHALARAYIEVADDRFTGLLENATEYAIVYACVTRIDSFQVVTIDRHACGSVLVFEAQGSRLQPEP